LPIRVVLTLIGLYPSVWMTTMDKSAVAPNCGMNFGIATIMSKAEKLERIHLMLSAVLRRTSAGLST